MLTFGGAILIGSFENNHYPKTYFTSSQPMAKMRPKTPPAKDPDQVDFKGDEQLANDYKKMYNR